MTSSRFFIPVILGTARKERRSEQVAQFILRFVEKEESVETQLIDVRDYMYSQTIPPWENNPATQPWRTIAERADGFIFVVPEYNHGYPGELKLLLDQALDEYAHKPVLVCGVSSGQFGGARVIEHLHMVWRELGLVHTGSVYFPNMKVLFDETTGVPTDPAYQERIPKRLNEFLVYAEALRVVRNRLSPGI